MPDEALVLVRRVRAAHGLEQQAVEVGARDPLEHELVDKPFTDLPATGSVIGAVIRNGDVLFPHKTDTLQAGDRVIVFVESKRASLVERAL